MIRGVCRVLLPLSEIGVEGFCIVSNVVFRGFGWLSWGPVMVDGVFFARQVVHV